MSPDSVSKHQQVTSPHHCDLSNIVADCCASHRPCAFRVKQRADLLVSMPAFTHDLHRKFYSASTYRTAFGDMDSSNQRKPDCMNV